MMSDGTLIATIGKNASQEVRVTLSEFKGSHNLDVRVFAAYGGDDERKPTKKGVSLKLDKLDELMVALGQARMAAERLGLLKGGAV